MCLELSLSPSWTAEGRDGVSGEELLPSHQLLAAQWEGKGVPKPPPVLWTFDSRDLQVLQWCSQRNLLRT